MEKLVGSQPALTESMPREAFKTKKGNLREIIVQQCLRHLNPCSSQCVYGIIQGFGLAILQEYGNRLQELSEGVWDAERNAIARIR